MCVCVCETFGKNDKYCGMLILHTVAFIKHYYRIDAKLQLTFSIYIAIIIQCVVFVSALCTNYISYLYIAKKSIYIYISRIYTRVCVRVCLMKDATVKLKNTLGSTPRSNTQSCRTSLNSFVALKKQKKTQPMRARIHTLSLYKGISASVLQPRSCNTHF